MYPNTFIIIKSFYLKLDMEEKMYVDLHKNDIITIIEKNKRYTRFYIGNDNSKTYTTKLNFDKYYERY